MAKILFEETFLIPIMCYASCASSVYNGLSLEGLNLENASLLIDSNPSDEEGHHQITLTIISESEEVEQEGKEELGLITDTERQKRFRAHFVEQFNAIGFPEKTPETPAIHPNNVLNIGINILGITLITALSLIFPPSLLLTVVLTSLSVATSTFTARHYLKRFFNMVRNRHFESMPFAISMGALLSAGHILFHAISLPLMLSFSDVAMNFIMPIVLMILVNGMDEIKRQVTNRAQKIKLQGMKSLFPEMRQHYETYALPLRDRKELIAAKESKDHELWLEQASQSALDGSKFTPLKKSLLQKGMLIKVKKGDCFPVDGFLIQGTTYVDASIHTGEPRQKKYQVKIGDTMVLDKQSPHFVPSGAINLGDEVVIYADKDSFNSMANQMLSSSSIAPQETKTRSHKTFSALYSVLIFLGLVAALVTPLALGVLNLNMGLHNLMSIVFAVCPCTIAFAHFLPGLFSANQRGKHGIVLRKPEGPEYEADLHTIVFDKTGTLTTGESTMVAYFGIEPALWQKIYLLESRFGGAHPIARAVTTFYDKTYKKPEFKEILDWDGPLFPGGLSGHAQDTLLHVGKLEYLTSCLGVKQLTIPPNTKSLIDRQEAQGYTTIYVAQDKTFCGVFFIEHKVRKNIVKDLLHFIIQGIDVVLLTGDTQASALSFNKKITTMAKKDYPQLFEEMVAKRRAKRLNQLAEQEQKSQPSSDETLIFTKANTLAGQEPLQKKDSVTALLKKKGARGFCGIGDGPNDNPFLSVIDYEGGLSCAMTPKEKAAYSATLSLNGSLDYLFLYKKISKITKNIVLQNQFIIATSTLIFLSLIVSFSAMGLDIAPIIPLIIMAFTTGCTLFNCYRTKLAVDVIFDANGSWVKSHMASVRSVGLLFGSGLLLAASFLLYTLSTGTMALPPISFAGSALDWACSFCLLGSMASSGLFVLIGGLHAMRGIREYCYPCRQNDTVDADKALRLESDKPRISSEEEEVYHDRRYSHSSAVLRLECADYLSGLSP